MASPAQHRAPSHGQHLMLGLCAATVFLALGFRALQKTPLPAAPAPLNLAVEHGPDAHVAVLRSRGSGRNVMEFTTLSGSGVYMHLPSAWKRREVRSGALSDIHVTKSVSGYARWTAPQGVTASFWSEGNGSWIIQNASSTPLLLELTDVDVRTGRTTHRTTIVSDKAAEL